MIEPFKYLVQPVALERDGTTGRAVRELPGSTVTVYDAEQAAQAIVEFELQLGQLQQEEEVVTDADRADGHPEHQLR
jgi:hypothetical protein